MLSPATAMMIARARQAEVRREAEASSMTGRDVRNLRRGGTRGIGDSTSARRLLIAKTSELIRLSDSLGCKRDELVRMIQSLS
jgi:hypothetical protein